MCTKAIKRKMKFYRLPWNKEKTDYLIKYWPHWGTYGIATQLHLTRTQVKGKADKLKLKMLPKTERICILCKTDFQFARRAGFLCKKCFSNRRKENRKKEERTLRQWIADSLRTLKYRSKEPCDLTIEYMIGLWEQQKGKCYYSELTLQSPHYGSGRSPNAASVDRIDPKRGYIQGNVVWSAWACNIGKWEMSVKEYIEICRAVVTHYDSFLPITSQ